MGALVRFLEAVGRAVISGVRWLFWFLSELRNVKQPSVEFLRPVTVRVAGSFVEDLTLIFQRNTKVPHKPVAGTEYNEITRRREKWSAQVAAIKSFDLSRETWTVECTPLLMEFVSTSAFLEGFLSSPQLAGWLPRDFEAFKDLMGRQTVRHLYAQDPGLISDEFPELKKYLVA